MHLPDVVAEQTQIARRGDHDAIAGAAHQAKRTRIRRCDELVEHDIALRPHDLVDARYFELKWHFAFDAAAEEWSLQPGSLRRHVDHERTGLFVVNDFPT